MANYTDHDLSDDDRVPTDCTFCGGKATAFWVGAVSVACCPGCATTSLAHLAADALVGPAGHQPGAARRLTAPLERFTAEFWRAAALAISNAASRLPRVPR